MAIPPQTMPGKRICKHRRELFAKHPARHAVKPSQSQGACFFSKPEMRAIKKPFLYCSISLTGRIRSIGSVSFDATDSELVSKNRWREK
jgi:hypothetical protein